MENSEIWSELEMSQLIFLHRREAEKLRTSKNDVKEQLFSQISFVRPPIESRFRLWNQLVYFLETKPESYCKLP